MWAGKVLGLVAREGKVGGIEGGLAGGCGQRDWARDWIFDARPNLRISVLTDPSGRIETDR